MNKKIFIAVLVLASILAGHRFIDKASATVPAIHTRISVNNSGDGQGGNNFTPGGSGDSARISADGRYVVFPSFASNLVDNDTNGKQDIFIRDLNADQTLRVNVSSSGVQANDSSGVSGVSGVAISQNGRYVAFTSLATNLIDGSTISGLNQQIYIKDMKDQTVKLVTRNSAGDIGNAVRAYVTNVSNDGRFVLWAGNKSTSLVSEGGASESYHVYLADTKYQSFELITPKDGSSLSISDLPYVDMSCDGSFIVTSTKDQLVDSDSDSAADIYLFDLRNGVDFINLTDQSSNSAIRPSISCNGDYITFESTDPVFDSAVDPSDTSSHLYFYDRLEQDYNIVDITSGGVVSYGDSYGSAGIDDKGNVVFGAVNSPVALGSTRRQMVIKYRDTAALELVSRNAFSNGAATQATGVKASITSDGTKVVYGVGNPANSLFAPSTATWNDYLMYDTNGYGDVVMSLTGL